MSDMTTSKISPEEREYELRAQIGSIWSGGRLFIGVYTFLLASFVFTYFYLRSTNAQDLWRTPGESGPVAMGYAIWICTVLVAFLANYGRRRLRAGFTQDFVVAGWTGTGLGLLALFFQIYILTQVSFYPGANGYASMFIGYSIFNIGTLVAVTYWIETTTVRAMRVRREVGGDKPELSKHESAQLFRADIASMAYFQGFIAVAATLFLAMFYWM
ncbi:MAG: hypothetical protein KGR42_05745 [Acidobacteria bacterium]|nr:hypothetical protein [Acidobacteriota bacterium]